MQRKSKLTIKQTLLIAALVPMTISMVILVMFITSRMRSIIDENTYEMLYASSSSVSEYFKYDIMEDILSQDEISYNFIDSLKSKNIEQTLILGDTRYITSLRNIDGTRNEGTKIDSEIYETLKKGEDYRGKAIINGESYYVYYTPVYDIDESFLGGAFAGQKESIVSKAQLQVINLTIIIAIVLEVLFLIVALLISKLVIAPMKEVSEAVATISKGELNVSLKTTSHIKELVLLQDSTDTLRDSLKQIIGETRSNMDNLTFKVGVISNAISQSNDAKDGIAASVEEIARGAIDQSEALQLATFEMSHMGENIDEISSLTTSANDDAEEVERISEIALTNLTKLLEANKETINSSLAVYEGIDASNKTIEQIKNASKVITDISFQTNLLSLNASIEAARAGEFGRGFAVVAEEIRNLADLSASQAKEIEEVVNDIVAKSNTNMTLANDIKDSINQEGLILEEVNESFKKVEECVEKTSEKIQNIENRMTSLNEIKDKLTDQVTNLSAISEENAASSEQTTASTEELGANIENIHQQSKEIEDAIDSVNKSLSFFKQGEQDS